MDEFVDACATGNLEKVKILFSKIVSHHLYSDIPWEETKIFGDGNCFVQAIKANHIAVVNFIVFSIEQINRSVLLEYSEQIIEAIVDFQRLEMAKIFINEIPWGEELLLAATKKEQIDLILLIVEDEKYEIYKTIEYACEYGKINVVKYFTRGSIPLANKWPRWVFTALQYQNFEIVYFLLDRVSKQTLSSNLEGMYPEALGAVGFDEIEVVVEVDTSELKNTVITWLLLNGPETTSFSLSRARLHLQTVDDLFQVAFNSTCGTADSLAWERMITIYNSGINLSEQKYSSIHIPKLEQLVAAISFELQQTIGCCRYVAQLMTSYL